MNKIEIFFEKPDRNQRNTIDLYQIQVINLYTEAINIPRIKEMIDFICRDKGYMSGIKQDEANYFVQLGPSVQCSYQDLVIGFAKKLLRYYHEGKTIKITPWGRPFEKPVTFDCRSLSHEERGMLTKILKMENKRLSNMGIKNRRQKKRFSREIFLSEFT